MSRKTQPTLCVLDLGTSRTRVLAAVLEEDRLRFLAYAAQPSQGVQKGAVVNLQAASQGIALAVEQAERQAGIHIEEVTLSLTGAHMRGLPNHATYSLAGRSREISQQDVQHVLDLAQQMELPEGYELLHMRALEYILDRQPGVRDPVGLVATRLEARTLLITGASGPVQNRVSAANMAGLKVQELLFTPLAAADALLQAEEREQGVALVEVGASCTGVLAVAQGAVQHAAVIAVGGDNFTRDVAIAFNTPLTAAEGMKHSFGQVLTAGMSERAEIEAPGIGDHPSRMILHRQFCDHLRERAEELTHQIEDDLRRSGWLHRLGAGIVLTGGGAVLGGFAELMRQQLRLPVRIGVPPLLEGMSVEFAKPEFSFLLGGIMAAQRRFRRRQEQPGLWQRFWSRLETTS